MGPLSRLHERRLAHPRKCPARRHPIDTDDRRQPCPGDRPRARYGLECDAGFSVPSPRQHPRLDEEWTRSEPCPEQPSSGRERTDRPLIVDDLHPGRQPANDGFQAGTADLRTLRPRPGARAAEPMTLARETRVIAFARSQQGPVIVFVPSVVLPVGSNPALL